MRRLDMIDLAKASQMKSTLVKTLADRVDFDVCHHALQRILAFSVRFGSVRTSNCVEPLAGGRTAALLTFPSPRHVAAG